MVTGSVRYRPGHHASPSRATRGAATRDREGEACPAKPLGEDGLVQQSLPLRGFYTRQVDVARGKPVCYISVMTKDQVKEILDRVLTWQQADQEKVARFVRQVEQRRADDDITEEEWLIIEERAARRDLASDEEVEAVFSRYRNA